eukprot:Em0001g1447a
MASLNPKGYRTSQRWQKANAEPQNVFYQTEMVWDKYALPIFIVDSISNAPFIIDITSPRPATIESISNAPPIIIDITSPRPATIESISNAPPIIIDITSPRPATIESISNAPPIIIDITSPRPVTILG